MKRVVLETETDFAGWRTAARAAILSDVPPHDIVWHVGSHESDLFADEPMAAPTETAAPRFNVSRAFVDLAQTIIAHRDPARFSLMYRLLWRLRQTPQLLLDASDADVDAARSMEKAIRRDIHKMHAFVRFREVASAEGESTFVAWFEPEHHIVELAAPFFMRRFTGMRWAILTPDRSAYWDGGSLSFGPAASRGDVPDADRLEDYWRTYYAAIFNPARLKVDAMQKEMPKKYWKNLPEAELIDGLVRAASRREAEMIAAEPTERSRFASAVARQEKGVIDMPQGEETPASLAEARLAASRCRRCDLYAPATQVVFGEGPDTAQMMFVGEQPGDKEDLAGHPFVGPAGMVFDKALREAGIARGEAYVTNAVKHFKYEPRGKFRLHKKPDTKEITACRYWLDLEKSFLQPKIIVALGASAGQALLGRTVRIGAERGRPIPQGNDAPVFITVHPSYLLRLPDEAAKEQEYARFVQDLTTARQAAGL